MYQKYLVNKLVLKYAPLFISYLNLDKWKINFHIYKCTSKELVNMKVAKESRTHLAGISFIGNKTADIVIYYDCLKNREDALGTLIHELLHLRLFELSGLVTIKQDSACKIEENIVL